MLLAVEGGGFFSSSASGYSKGLTLLLLGQKNEEKPMRVAPWNQYQLVDQETDPQIQLAPPGGKNRFVRGCTTFVCFGRAAAGLESSSSQLKVGPTQHQENLPKTADSDKCRDQSDSTQSGEDCDDNCGKFTLSSLKRPSTSNPVVEDGNDEHSVFCGKDSDAVINTEARTVQWTDTSGGELAADSDKCRDQSDFTQSGEDCDDNYGKFTLRSNLKRPLTSNPVVEDGNDEHSIFCGKDSDAVINTEARTVQWTDASGGELAEIREFEPSDDDGSDDEFDNGHQKTCACTIM